MKLSTYIRLGLLGAAAVALSGCGGGGGGATVTTQPTSVASSFGTQFAIDFAASPNSQPVKPQSGDIIPLSLTTEPIPLH